MTYILLFFIFLANNVNATSCGTALRAINSEQSKNDFIIQGYTQWVLHVLKNKIMTEAQWNQLSLSYEFPYISDLFKLRASSEYVRLTQLKRSLDLVLSLPGAKDILLAHRDEIRQKIMEQTQDNLKHEAAINGSIEAGRRAWGAKIIQTKLPMAHWEDIKTTNYFNSYERAKWRINEGGIEIYFYGRNLHFKIPGIKPLHATIFESGQDLYFAFLTKDKGIQIFDSKNPVNPVHEIPVPDPESYFDFRVFRSDSGLWKGVARIQKSHYWIYHFFEKDKKFIGEFVGFDESIYFDSSSSKFKKIKFVGYERKVLDVGLSSEETLNNNSAVALPQASVLKVNEFDSFWATTKYLVYLAHELHLYLDGEEPIKLPIKLRDYFPEYKESTFYPHHIMRAFLVEFSGRKKIIIQANQSVRVIIIDIESSEVQVFDERPSNQEIKFFKFKGQLWMLTHMTSNFKNEYGFFLFNLETHEKLTMGLAANTFLTYLDQISVLEDGRLMAFFEEGRNGKSILKAAVQLWGPLD